MADCDFAKNRTISRHKMLETLGNSHKRLLEGTLTQYKLRECASQSLFHNRAGVGGGVRDCRRQSAFATTAELILSQLIIIFQFFNNASSNESHQPTAVDLLGVNHFRQW